MSDAPSNPKIAFQGEPGAYSHLACLEFRPEMEPLPCPTFEDAFNSVAEGGAKLAMIPIENSVAGRVADIHHLIPQSDLYIVGEHFLRINHHLLAPKGASLKTLKTVWSHAQALGQCRETLRDLGLKPLAAADTAGAARMIGEENDLSKGALASSLAAETYGLEIIKEAMDMLLKYVPD